MGNKRFFARKFAEVLRQRADNIDTIVDLFGGSGLLSRIAKDTLPDRRVIYNDYDGYSQRLAAIPATNKVLSQLRAVLACVEPGGRIPDNVRETALKMIERSGATDFLTIGAAVLFSGRTASTLYELKHQRPWYNYTPRTDYNADGYLDGLEVVCEDWSKLHERHRDPHTLFACDPPYLTTQAGNYKGGRYWPLTAYLDILLALRGCRFVYFTSGKSQLVELCEWLSANTDFNLLQDAETIKRTNNVRSGCSYTDIMISN